MTNKKDSRSSAATPERENETRAPGQATHISRDNNITNRNQKQYKIAPLLPRGKENAISSADLLSMSGLHTTRQLQTQIAAERIMGALILSSTTGGYFSPDYGEKGKNELTEYIRSLQARALNTLKILKSAKEEEGNRREAVEQEILNEWTV